MSSVALRVAEPGLWTPGDALDLMDVDLHSGKPWPIYNWLREEAPLYRDVNGMWVVSRYDDVVRVAMDTEGYTSRDGNRPFMPNDHSFIHKDGEEHQQRRGLIQRWFTPTAVDKMEGYVRQVVSGLIDEVIERGECDFVRDIAARLPVRLICEMTGIPEEYHDLVLEWTDVFVKAGNGPDWVNEEANEAFMNFGALHLELLDERLAQRRKDFLSLWLDARPGGSPMSEDDMLWEHTMLIVGGTETTRNAMSAALWLLWQHDDQRQALLRGEVDAGNAAEEVLRWSTPFISMSRVVARPVELYGQTLAPGDTMLMLYPPANRDPRKFDRPQEFDIRREFKNRILSFGIGRHVCIGAHLARLESRVVLQEVLKRLPDWEPVGEPAWIRSNYLRGMTSLPIRFTPGRRLGS